MEQPIPKEDLIDIIAVNPTTGFVELVVIDDKPWDDYLGHMKWLLDKLNLYIGYVFGGQINEDPRYAGRPVKFVVHFAGRPPQAARLTVVRMRDHLARQNIAFGATEGTDITAEVDIDSWADAPY